ncbi:MAG: hypothetical protein HKO91_10445 [Desulfobacterales bacterium]|nr:hypothetical protein [Desulfobacterales bacterium]
MDDFNNKNQVIWTLRVKLPQTQSECVWVIEIEPTATFLELHEAIQDAVDFDNDHLFEFFIGRHPGNRAYTIGGEPNWDTFNPVRTYQNVRISSVWPLPTGMKLYYLFDFGDNWLFQINKTRHKDKLIQPGIVYPRVIEARGKNPEQYPDWEGYEV